MWIVSRRVHPLEYLITNDRHNIVYLPADVSK